MMYIFKDAHIYLENEFKRASLIVNNGIIQAIDTNGSSVSNFNGAIIDCANYYIFPGLADVHVHFREPGFSYKETIKSGSKAAAHGGYTTVSTMPNLNPVPDSLENLKIQLDIIQKDSLIDIIPYGAITVGEKGEKLADLAEMSPHVCAFTDDGRGVQNEQMMLQAMQKAKSLNKIIAAHCEDNSLLNGGYIHDGEYAKAHNHKGISSESEWKQVERDLKLVEKSGCAYHVCHISTKETVELIRQAKKHGLNVTCETAPHYLLLSDNDLQEDARFKMNPPLRSAEDKAALIEGILDGTIELIATDHAPHTLAEKSQGLAKSPMGVVGLETAFPLMYTHFVKKGILSLEKLIQLMSINPRKRFYGNMTDKGLQVGQKADFTIYDLNQAYTIDPRKFYTQGRSCPFDGWEVFGRCLGTWANGKIAFLDNAFNI